MEKIVLNISKAAQFLPAEKVQSMAPAVKAAIESLENGSCPGNGYLGWLHLPSSITTEHLAELKACAQVLR